MELLSPHAHEHEWVVQSLQVPYKLYSLTGVALALLEEVLTCWNDARQIDTAVVKKGTAAGFTACQGNRLRKRQETISGL